MQPFRLLLFLLCPIYLFAQPMPCSDPPMMTSFCVDACIICDIDGFTGRNGSVNPGEAPPGFCTTTVHNGQWIAFIAGSEKLRLRLDVSNCRRTGAFRGLEVGIYEGINCDNFKLVSNCDGDVASNQVFEANNLTIGQYYYLVMDGNGGDMCDWTFTVLEGDTRVDPLETSGAIVGNFETCPNIPQTYFIDAPIGATEFRWELDGNNLGINAPDIPLFFDRTGVFNLCVTAFNACDQAPPSCRQVLVKTIPTTDLGKVKICIGDDFEVADTLLNTTGVYEFHEILENGCDSVILVDLEAVAPSFTDYGAVNICEGDELPIGGKSFTEPGFYTEVLTNKLGCDSTITIDLFTVECTISGVTAATTAICNNEASGSLDFSVTSGTPPFNYSWTRIDKTKSGTGMVESLNDGITIPDLLFGTYLIEIKDQLEEFDNQTILIVEVPEPPPMVLKTELSNYSGYEVSCADGADGQAMVQATGGIPPYVYEWSNGMNLNQITALASGNYSVSVTDNLGCERVERVLLEAPTPLFLEANFVNPTCEGLESGRIIVQSIGGGVGSTYQFSLNDQAFTEESEFTNLGNADYLVKARDNNNCIVEISGTLTAAIIPEIELGKDRTIELADSLLLTPKRLAGADLLEWRQDIGISCLDCPTVSFSPTNPTTYLLTATSIDNCSTTDSITINVLKIRDVYAPNVFSPNSDGINDQFYLFGGPEVLSVNVLRIYTRWGEQLFERKDFLVNDASVGWDGLYRGDKLDSGVYVWMAEINFIDGETLIYSGDVAIIE